MIEKACEMMIGDLLTPPQFRTMQKQLAMLDMSDRYAILFNTLALMKEQDEEDQMASEKK